MVPFESAIFPNIPEYVEFFCSWAFFLTQKLLCEMWNIDPKDAVMVGDYLYDIQAGFEAGSQTILIQRGQETGFTPQTPFQPNLEIHSFLEIL